MKPHLHPYLRFRVRLARQALLQFIPSLVTSLEYLVLGGAPVLIGLLACIALPGLYAASQPWPQALAWLGAQTLLASAPVWLLRKRLHPAAVARWSWTLPLTPRLRYGADALSAAILVGPLAIAYAISSAVWLYQWPDWLRPVAAPALLLTLLSLLLAWLLSTLTLARLARMPSAPAPGRARPAPASYSAPRPGMLTRYHGWHRLFWLPFWRGEQQVGLQQTTLLLGAALAIFLWLWRPPLLQMVAPALWGASAAVLLMLLTDRGDKALAGQIALLRPVCASWPRDTGPLFRLAIVLSLLPGLALLAWFAALTLGRQHAGSGYSSSVAMVWLGVAALAQIALVSLRRLSPRGRVGLVIGAILILTAIGSELWN